MILDQLGIELRALGSAYRLRPRPLSSPTRFAGRAAVVGIAVAAGVVSTTGVGYAYWRTTGTGTGTAATGTVDLHASATAGPTGLYPGGDSGDVTVTVTNSGDGAVQVTSLTGTASTLQSGCDASRVTFTPPATLPLVPAGDFRNITGTVAMDPTADSACQGATFNLTFTVNGTVG